MTDTFSKGLYDYFKACPLLEGERLNFNYQSVESSGYAITSVPSSPPLKRYTRGGSKREKLFTLGSIEGYSPVAQVNIDQSEFYEHLAAWVDEQNRRRNFPKLPEGITPRSLECVTDGYIDSTDGANAHYQIQMKLTYYQEGAR